MTKGILKKASKGRYQIVETEKGFKLLENNEIISEFTRANFRETLEKLNRGPGWIGAILRMLMRKYPSRVPRAPITNQERLRRIGEDKLNQYLQAKGFKVYKPIKVSDMEAVKYLEAQGYLIEGFIKGDIYYKSAALTTEDTLKKVCIN